MRKLAGQTATYGISSILARFISFSLTPYFTRIMSQAEFGAYTDIYALIPFALTLLTMGMEVGYLRFAGKAGSAQEKGRIFATAWGAVGLVSVIFFVVALLFQPQLAAITKYSDRSSYISIIAAIIMLDAITAVPFARLREQGRAGRYATIKVISVVITVGLSLFFYLIWPRITSVQLFPTPTDPGYAFLANLASSFVTLLILIPDCPAAPRINRKLFATIFLYSLPLLISGLMGTANEYIDRQFVKYLMPDGQAELGIYGSVAKIASLMILFTQMYRYAAEPFFLSEFKKDDFKTSNAEAMKFFIIASIFIFLILGLFPDLIGRLLGSKFRGGMSLLPIMLLSNIMTGIILNLSFWYKQSGATKYSIIITATGLLLTVIFNLLLIPILGILGAALARLICETVMVAVSYSLNRRHYPVPYDLRRIGTYAALGAAVYLAASALSAFSGVNLWLGYFVNIALIAIFAVYVLRREKIDVRGLVSSILKRKK